MYKNHNTLESKVPPQGFFLFMEEMTPQNQLWGWGFPGKKVQK